MYSFKRIAIPAILGLLLSSCPLWAATQQHAQSANSAGQYALNGPRGLAVDSKGNLYVANQSGNEILIYNDKYKQQTGRTITTNISTPTSVALDPYGNIWVANYANSSITEYSSSGQQNTSATITGGINGPNSLAVDGLADIWVENSYESVNIYAADGSFIKTYSPNTPIFGIATRDQYFAWGGTNYVTRLVTGQYLAGNNDGLYNDDDEGLACAFDAAGDLYVANANNTITYYNTAFDGYGFVNLSFAPAGIAVDSPRSRIYVSNQNGNSIAVYNTSGTLIHTIN
jgi:hypothetical protein